MDWNVKFALRECAWGLLTMPLAFPTHALYQGYLNDTGSPAGYYTNDESEVGTPASTHVKDEFVIDPALLAESGSHQVSILLPKHLLHVVSQCVSFVPGPCHF